MADIKTMVDRFLGWPLPKDFGPDGGITFKPIDHPACWPVGTNLFTATQAKAMLEHVLGEATGGEGVRLVTDPAPPMDTGGTGPYEANPYARLRWLERQHTFDQVLEARSRSERDTLIHHVVEAAIARGVCDAKVVVTMDKVADLCGQLSLARPVGGVFGRWIPIEERMPDIGQLIAIRYGPDADVWDAYRYFASMDGIDFSHWMPLPEAPK